MARATCFVVILFLLSVSASAKTSVYGRVTGVDGKPMLHAMVILTYPSDNRPVKEVKVDKNGHYHIAIDYEGLWTLHFIGTFHHSYVAALYLNSRRAVRLNVRLATYNYADNLSRAAIVGNFNRWSLYHVIRMKENSKGRYYALVKSTSDTLFYRLVNVRTGGLVEGTDADGYKPYGIDGYSSFLTSGKSEVKITFDPRKLKRSNRRPRLSIKTPDIFESRFTEAFAVYQNTKYVYDSSLYRHIADFQMGHFRFNFNTAIDSVKDLMKVEKNKVIKQVLQLSYCGLKAMNTYKRYIDVGTSQKTLKSIPPGSVVWSLDPEVMWMALDHAAYTALERKRYIRSVLNTNPTPGTKEYLLRKEIDRCFHSLQYSRITGYLSILLDQYGNSPEARLEKRIYAGNYIQIKKGAQAPTFAVRSLPDSKVFYTDSTFSGKYYLIVFWSILNRKSVNEIEAMRGVLRKYGSRQFKVISVSVDRSPGAVSGFVHRHHLGAGWMNGIEEKGLESKLCKDFEVYSVPKAILVNPDGKIVSEGWALRGDGLEKVLYRCLIKNK